MGSMGGTCLAPGQPQLPRAVGTLLHRPSRQATWTRFSGHILRLPAGQENRWPGKSADNSAMKLWPGLPLSERNRSSNSGTSGAQDRRSVLPADLAGPKVLIRMALILILGLLPGLPDHPAYSQTEEPFPGEIDFGQEKRMGLFITGRELEIWASQRGLEIAPDCPMRDLADSEAEVVSEKGSHFQLYAPGRGRTYLYIDFVSFRKQGTRNRPLEPHCYPSTEEIRLESNTELPVQFLEIWINGRKFSTQVFGAASQPASPLIIPVSREWMPERSLRIELRPGPGNQMIAVWDAFLSQVPPEPGY